ncbi:hypothetical protein BGI09_07995, partial [Snodgrassella alvi]|uniref:hypothetical protein n=1 Tax=Snodgrassella alvi TaxID=1196083 RepID=UPI000A0BABA3
LSQPVKQAGFLIIKYQQGKKHLLKLYFLFIKYNYFPRYYFLKLEKQKYTHLQIMLFIKYLHQFTNA